MGLIFMAIIIGYILWTGATGSCLKEVENIPLYAQIWFAVHIISGFLATSVIATKVLGLL